MLQRSGQVTVEQLPGDVGHGWIDEITGVCGFQNEADPNEFSWPAQSGATNYEVVRSTEPQFGTDCMLHGTTATYWDDGTPVPLETCFHYLVRGLLGRRTRECLTLSPVLRLA